MNQSIDCSGVEPQIELPAVYQPFLLDGRSRSAPNRRWPQASAVMAAISLACFIPIQAQDLPLLASGHTDIGINFEDGNWDLHVHAESLDEEYAPEAVWLKVASATRTVVPSNTAFQFLGGDGDSIWVLPATHREDVLFLGLGTEEMAPGLFQGDEVKLALASVEGPGDFSAYHLDAFGTPVISFRSNDGIGPDDIRYLTAGGHAHVNWTFSAPGKYRIGFQASGVLAANGESTTSEVAYYQFDVGEIPHLQIRKEAGPNNPLLLQWLSETNVTYQLQTRSEAGLGTWVNFGLPIPGNGSTLEEHIKSEQVSQLFRLSLQYHSKTEPGILARLFVAEATNTVLSISGVSTKAALHEVLTPPNPH